MKTKLSKKSFAAGLAALVLSTGAFLGASLLVSQDAEAAYCNIDKDGTVIMDCDLSNDNQCQLKLIAKDGVYTMNCTGVATIYLPSLPTE